MAVKLDYDDKIAIIRLGDDENRFSPAFLDDVEAALDQVISDGALGLVTTAGGKFYSNGLDLDWLSAHTDRGPWYINRVHRLLARVLTLSVPTAAAMVGHAFGAGAMLAIAHDFRAMRDDRGYFCFPEVDIRIPFNPGMAALIQSKLTPRAAVASMTTGRRFSGPDAAQFGIVDVACPADAVTGTAVDQIRPSGGKDPGTLRAIKQTMFGHVVRALTDSDEAL
ncbi:enoyl-CoA hydratase-related protein [Mycobacterium intracellulare]|uniref:enoyl-CoA hydratase-related protein n=1 Tax=Mycobacterium intracellulare TaxID=1767 RepID=UPI0006CA9E61|nr:enoyl-CoA hydratase-related protein [Mycobacterium intracellulare]AOS92106.1 enoyl-CoA hydratase [Mycobacterium intracellulare subsp. chimaera]ARV82270.1 enoyl-CoA hydratase [Mycobacterium intracellulare subsp. chimaera]ASL09407.1 enoyl-CoA hydratase [Mycobacterium intracellulare subsp. chimaera]ASL21222.1 enoyl-CoA hydratase [Mycobacterium intracellulare subsp. chimaera]KPN45189.1 enoyl-CoA hydratase [Mycobacterium intracellulare subsp. chimaera]